MSDRAELVVTADIHFHDWATHASGSGADNSRLRQTCSVIGESLEYARDRDIPWLCGGDFFQTIAHTENAVMTTAIELFERYPEVMKFGVWGDHDTRGKGSTPVTAAESATTILAHNVENLHILKGRDTGRVGLHRGGIALYGAGAQPKADFIDLGPGGDIGLFHLMVSGSKTGSGYELPSGIEGHELANLYRLTICGDVHHPQEYWSNDGRLLLVPGSPEHHNFGDTGDHGWWTVEMEERGDGWWPVEATMHPSDSPKFLTVPTMDDVDEDDPHHYRVTDEEVDEDDVPDGVDVIGSPPTTIETRDTLTDAHTSEEIVQVWMDEQDIPADQREAYADIARELLDASGEILQLRDCQLKTIEIENFLSFEDEVHEVRDGVNLVVGESRDFRSNGAGKSTLTVEAVYWCLFGRTTRDISADKVISWWGGPARVRLNLEMGDGTPLWIERRRKPGSVEVDAEIDGQPFKETSATATADRFCRALGITSDIYLAMACYNQEDLLLLTRETDATRKDLLGDWSGLGVYQDASTMAGREASELDEEIGRLDSRIEAHEESLTEAEDDLDEARGKRDEWEEQRDEELSEVHDALFEHEDDYRVEEAWDRVEAIRERASAIVDRRTNQIYANEEVRVMHLADERTAEIEDKIEHVRSSRAFPDLSREQIEEALDNWEQNKEQASERCAETQNQMSAAQDVRSRRSARLSSAESELESARELEPGALCPKCGQEIDDQHVEDITAEAEQEVEDAREAFEEADEKYEECHDEHIEAREQLDKASDRVTTLHTEIDRLDRIDDLEDALDDAHQQAAERAQEQMEREVEEVERHLESWVARAESAAEDIEDEYDREHNRLLEERDRLEQADNPHQSSVDTLESQIESLNKKITAATDRREEAARERDIYEFWNEGFSKQGIQSLLLDEIAAEFNQCRRQIFPVLTHGIYDVQFSTTRTTQSGEKREKTEFHVRYRGREVEYGSLSGGQKRRVDIGVMLTLILANARRQQVPGVLGWVVLDECFGFLDSDGAEALAATLDQMTDTIPSVYVITQNTEMQSLFPNTLLVQQDEDGRSHIVE